MQSLSSLLWWVEPRMLTLSFLAREVVLTIVDHLDHCVSPATVETKNKLTTFRWSLPPSAVLLRSLLSF
jgi:hypothetical protein